MGHVLRGVSVALSLSAVDTTAVPTRAANDPEIGAVAPVVFTGWSRPVPARPVVVVFLAVAVCVWKGRWVPTVTPGSLFVAVGATHRR
ncbi:MAG: hypothetical protein ACXVXF_08465 [Mycobacteriaceae bacterium]